MTNLNIFLDNYDFSEAELDTHVKHLNLSNRATNALLRYDITTLRDLLKAIEDIGLSRYYGMGKKSIEEIMEKLNKMQVKQYRDANAKLEDLEQKDKLAEKKIEKYTEIIENLNKARIKYQAQIKTLKEAHIKE